MLSSILVFPKTKVSRASSCNLMNPTRCRMRISQKKKKYKKKSYSPHSSMYFYRTVYPTPHPYSIFYILAKSANVLYEIFKRKKILPLGRREGRGVKPIRTKVCGTAIIIQKESSSHLGQRGRKIKAQC